MNNVLPGIPIAMDELAKLGYVWDDEAKAYILTHSCKLAITIDSLNTLPNRQAMISVAFDQANIVIRDATKWSLTNILRTIGLFGAANVH